MGIFDGVIQKAKDTTDNLKLSSMISDEEKKINQLSLEIGQLYFQLHADSCEPPFEIRINAIKDAKAKIAQYSEEIKRLKGVTNCPQCGAQLPYDTAFCSACGHKMEQKPPVQTVNSNQITCTKCGAVLPENAMFCTNCGAKVETVKPTELDTPIASEEAEGVN